jgi:hypothetical protein
MYYACTWYGTTDSYFIINPYATKREAEAARKWQGLPNAGAQYVVRTKAEMQAIYDEGNALQSCYTDVAWRELRKTFDR